MQKRVKGSFDGIDGILLCWITKFIRLKPLNFLNAFMLMVGATMAEMSDLTGRHKSDEYFQKLARRQGFDKEWIDGVLNDAKSKDYNHLVATLLDNTKSLAKW